MSDLEFEARQEQVREDMLDEIYNHMGVLYEGHDMEDIVQNVMKYVDTTYDDWERFFTPEQVEELIKQYTASLT